MTSYFSDHAARLVRMVPHTTMGRYIEAYDVVLRRHTCPTRWRWQLV